MKIVRFMSQTVALVMLALLGSAYSVAGVEEGIAGRIAKVGSVCVEGDDCAKTLTLASAGPRSGEEIYNTSCLACHASGAAGAPKFRNSDDWSPRLAAGLESVYANAINGKGAMPPKGMCMTCSDDEIKATVDYMIEGL